MFLHKLVTRLVVSSVILAYVGGAQANAQDNQDGNLEFKQAVEEGEALARRGDWARASDQFFKAASLQPNNELGFYDLGIAYLHLNQFEKAKIAEARAVQLNPKFVNAHIQMATVLVRLGNNEAAQECLQQALAIDPNNDTARRNLETLNQSNSLKPLKKSIATPVATVVPPAAVPIAPVATVVPPAAAPIVPVATGAPPAAVPIAPVATVVPPAAVPIAPVATVVPPAAVPIAPVATVAPPAVAPIAPVATVAPPAPAPITPATAASFAPIATIAAKAVANSTANAPPIEANRVKEKEKQNAAVIAARPITIPIGLGDGEFSAVYVAPAGAVTPKRPVPPSVVSDSKTDLRNAFAAYNFGKIDLAKKLIDDALKLEPQNECAYASYGAVLGFGGEVEAEVALERKALALNDKDAVAHMNLAWGLARLGKWQEASGEYNQAVALEPNLMEAKVGLGLAEMYTNNLALAQTTLAEATEKFPKEALPHIARSLLLARAGEYGEAQAELQKSVDLQPESPEALERVAAQELANENWQKAADIYSKVLKKYPQDSQAWLGLALSLEKTDLKQRALNSFRKAAELAPKNSLIHMALALAYESRGRVAEAELELEEALKLNPEYRLAATQVKEQQGQR